MKLLKTDKEFKQLYFHNWGRAKKHFGPLINKMKLDRPGVRVILHHIDSTDENYELWNYVIPLYNDDHSKLHHTNAKNLVEYSKFRAGKTLEELYGEEKAKDIKHKCGNGSRNRKQTTEEIEKRRDLLQKVWDENHEERAAKNLRGFHFSEERKQKHKEALAKPETKERQRAASKIRTEGRTKQLQDFIEAAKQWRKDHPEEVRKIAQKRSAYGLAKRCGWSQEKLEEYLCLKGLK
jgi:hypothetical protein